MDVEAPGGVDSEAAGEVDLEALEEVDLGLGLDAPGEVDIEALGGVICRRGGFRDAQEGEMEPYGELES